MLEIADKSTREMGELLAEVTPTDLVRYGLIPEFVGRVPVECIPPGTGQGKQ